MRFRDPLRRAPSNVSLGLWAALAVVACTKAGSDPAPAASAVAPAAPPSAGAGQPAACTVGPEKVWGDGASVLAGITQTDFEGRPAFGALEAGQPLVLTFDAKGEGEAKRVTSKKALSEVLDKQKARREIQRVTPALGAKNEVVAYVDWVKLEANKRTVACGRADSNEEVLKFEGKPLVVVDEDSVIPIVKKAAPKPAASASAEPKGPSAAPPQASASAAAETARVAKLREIQGRLKTLQVARENALERPGRTAIAEPPHRAPPAPAAPAPPPPPAPSVAAPSAKGESKTELRDCRSLVDRGGLHVFSAGSELVSTGRDDGTVDYTMNLFVADDHGRGKVTLSTSSIGKKPETLPDFDAPTAFDLGGGEHALTARHRGSVFSWLLDATRHPRGPQRAFPLVSPGVPRFAAFGPETSLLVVSREGGRSVAESLLFEQGMSQLPASLTALRLGDFALFGTVSGAMTGTRRFVAAQADEEARRLVLVPVDAALSASGPTTIVDSSVFESRLVRLPDERLLVVYLRGGERGRVELVSRTVQCG